MKINLWMFSALLFIYSVFSIGLFLISSGGWPAVFLGMGGAVFFGTIFLVALITIFNLRAQGLRNITITKSIFLLFGIQIFAILFNYAGCGDAPRGSFFYRRLLRPGISFCDYGNSFNEPSWVAWITALSFLLFFIAFLIGLFKMLSHASR